MEERMRTNEYWVELDRKYRMQTRPPQPVVMERGNGVIVWDVEGNEYIDFQSGQMTMLTGHTHPMVIQAIRQQVDMLMQTGIRFINIPRTLLAQKLAEITPTPLRMSYFCSTGSESNEAALRLVKLFILIFMIVINYHRFILTGKTIWIHRLNRIVGCDTITRS